MLHLSRKAPLRRLGAAALLLTGVFVLQGWSQQASAASSVRAKAGNVEDWTALTLAHSELHLEPPVVGEKVDMPRFTRELLQVKWRLDDPIDLYIIRPKGVPKPPVVLYLYSFPSDTSRFRDDRYCERVTAGGVAAVGFVTALTGHRYQNRPMKQWFVSELQESLATSVHDVQMILNFLAARDDLDLNKVGMFGAGSGGTIAILAASADPRIKAIDVLDPWGDWPDWLAGSNLIPDGERANYVQPEFLKKVASLDPLVYLPKLTQPVRIQDVLDDTDTPKKVKKRIESAAPKKAEVTRYDNTRELFSSVGGGRIFQWIKQQVQPAAAVESAAQHASQQPQPELRKVEPGHDD